MRTYGEYKFEATGQSCKAPNCIFVQSAVFAARVAVATQADMMLAKPGMGARFVDHGQRTDLLTTIAAVRGTRL
ncbi:MAG: hypothetical protein EOR01_28165 [Mesorhizobium sp.]|uniref:hypothetical protein n=1 Tax=Mesorhizobium sp. TaxID=1871066 RepID=UPI000FE57C9E|nr:hypothetical protein [Mesorhizobium sp.]RWP16095.1 MAG: hypothetical protein EOR01_28165 [Mesorhizobium sp.]